MNHSLSDSVLAMAHSCDTSSFKGNLYYLNRVSVMTYTHDWSSCTEEQLKAVLLARNLNQEGSQSDLVQRLIEHDAGKFFPPVERRNSCHEKYRSRLKIN